MLEAFIDGHPDVKVDFWFRDVIAGQELIEARPILLQHVSVVFPATALCENLQNIVFIRSRLNRNKENNHDIECKVRYF